MKKEKMERLVLLFILGLGLAYVYLNYLFLPQWENIQKQNTVFRERQQHLVSLQSRAGNTTGLQLEIKELERQRNELAKQIPDRLDKPAIMADLYAVAKNHDVAPETLTYGEVQSKEGTQELSLTLTCMGSPENILSMISDIISRPGPKLAVQGINLTAQKDGTMRAELKLISFALTGGAAPVVKPPFMNSSFGVDTAAQLFQP